MSLLKYDTESLVVPLQFYFPVLQACIIIRLPLQYSLIYVFCTFTYVGIIF